MLLYACAPADALAAPHPPCAAPRTCPVRPELEARRALEAYVASHGLRCSARRLGTHAQTLRRALTGRCREATIRALLARAP